MARKDFDAINVARQETGVTTGEVFAGIERGGSTRRGQGVASPEEQARRASDGRTQGRKGCKAARINAAFTADNYQFIRVMANVTGRTMTGFVNYVLDQYKQEHLEIYEQAKAIIDSVEGERRD